MNENLQRMIAKTLEELRQRKALPLSPNAADVRYAADFIVKKSPFAPYFAFLGVTKGSQIGRAFNNNKNELFFKVVLQLYYAKWYFKDSIPKLNNMEVLFKVENWKDVSYRAAHYCREFLRDMRYTIMSSRGVGAEAEWRYKLMTQDLKTLLLYNGDPSGFIKFAEESHCTTYPDAIALAIASNGWQKNEIINNWILENLDSICDAFIRNGKSRDLLSHCHGFKLRKEQSGKAQAFNKTEKSFCVFGETTHADLNRMAVELQDYCSHRIYQATHNELMEVNHTVISNKHDKTMHEVFAETIKNEGVPIEITNLANKLAEIHGSVQITTEASGTHIYIADPELLLKDGIKELSSRHLAINAEKFLGIGKYNVDLYPTSENKQLYMQYRMEGKEVPCAVSMKTKKVYSVCDLLAMLPLEKRLPLIRESIKHSVIQSDPYKYLVHDSEGNLVPEWPGDTVPLTELPEDHPAIVYLKTQRGFDIEDLSSTWFLCFCTNALPEDRSKNRFYSRLPGGYKNSPSGRIIIPIYDEAGVRRGWQARLIDYKDPKGNKWIYSDRNTWVKVEEEGSPLFISSDWPKGFAAHKYLNAKGSLRNKLLFGLKQAVDFNKNIPFEKRCCVLVEGPLDAVRGGPPCIALLGKSMSQDQAAIIRKNFSIVYTVMDRDAAGKECLRRIQQQLPGMQLIEKFVPDGKKDLGDCSYNEAFDLLYDIFDKR